MNLPEWLDLGRISQLGLIIMLVVQYVKTQIPDKWIKPTTLLFGVIISIVACLYMKEQMDWAKAVVNGVLAAILADTGYNFLSSKSGTFTLPAKNGGGK